MSLKFPFKPFVVCTVTYPTVHQHWRTVTVPMHLHAVYEVLTAVSKSLLCPCIHAPASGKSKRNLTKFDLLWFETVQHGNVQLYICLSFQLHAHTYIPSHNQHTPDRKKTRRAIMLQWLALTPSLPQPVKFLGWKMHRCTCKQNIFWSYNTPTFNVLGDSGGVVNCLDFCPALLKSLGCFYFQWVLSSQWKVVTVNLRILHCQL